MASLLNIAKSVLVAVSFIAIWTTSTAWAQFSGHILEPTASPTYIHDLSQGTSTKFVDGLFRSTDWSPDGTRVLAWLADSGDVWIFDGRGTKISTLPVPATDQPVWSPSGKSVLINSNGKIYLWSQATIRQVGQGRRPFWFPDETRLFYVDPVGNIVQSPIDPVLNTVMVTRSEIVDLISTLRLGQVVGVDHYSSHMPSMQWSVDGTSLAILTHVLFVPTGSAVVQRQSYVVIYRPQETPRLTLLESIVAEQIDQIRWSPVDPCRLAIMGGPLGGSPVARKVRRQLSLVNICSGAVDGNYNTLDQGWTHFSWSPDGTLIAAANGVILAVPTLNEVGKWKKDNYRYKARLSWR